MKSATKKSNKNEDEYDWEMMMDIYDIKSNDVDWSVNEDVNTTMIEMDDGVNQLEFDLIDKNGGGQILFDEFSSWGLTKSFDLFLENDDA